MPWKNDPQTRRQSSRTYGPDWRKQRGLALKRDRGQCVLCGSNRHPQVDHITPVSQGGTHQLTNLRTLCLDCHRKVTAQQGRGYRQTSQTQDPAPKPSTAWLCTAYSLAATASDAKKSSEIRAHQSPPL